MKYRPEFCKFWKNFIHEQHDQSYCTQYAVKKSFVSQIYFSQTTETISQMCLLKTHFFLCFAETFKYYIIFFQCNSYCTQQPILDTHNTFKYKYTWHLKITTLRTDKLVCKMMSLLQKSKTINENFCLRLFKY